jgi:hypothetical protein
VLSIMGLSFRGIIDIRFKNLSVAFFVDSTDTRLVCGLKMSVI